MAIGVPSSCAAAMLAAKGVVAAGVAAGIALRVALRAAQAACNSACNSGIDISFSLISNYLYPTIPQKNIKINQKTHKNVKYFTYKLPFVVVL